MRFTQQVLLLVPVAILLWAADDPFVGTRKFNSTKSKVDSVASLDGATITVDAVGTDTYRAVRVRPNLSDPARRKDVTNINFDGKEHQTGDASVVSISSRKDIFHHHTIFKKGGKEYQTLDATIQGKTLTVIRKGGGSLTGKPLPQPWIEVWEKE